MAKRTELSRISEMGQILGLRPHSSICDVANAYAAHFKLNIIYKNNKLARSFLRNIQNSGVNINKSHSFVFGKTKKNNFQLNKKSTCSDDFLMSYQWRSLRMKVLKKYGRKCACCGATPENGAVMNVDHIKPRRKYPELALIEDNLQVLCDVCNHGKGNWDETDWR